MEGSRWLTPGWVVREARIREVVQGPEGALYVLTDDDDGELLKLTPKS